MAEAIRALMPHQRDALDWARPLNAVALFKEMRLGKTLVAIRWIQEKKDARRILVACPLSVIESWERELRLEGETLVKLVGTRAQREKTLLAAPKTQRWFAINYEGLTERGHKTYSGKSKAVPSDFASLPWDCIIADESTRIRSAKAQITRVFLEALSSVKYRAALSGLPNPEGPEDFVTQFIFLHGEFMGCKSFWAWREAHMMEAGYGWVPKAKTLGLVRDCVHANAFVLSRKEAGIGNKKIREQRHVTLPPKVLRAISDAANKFEVGEDLTNNILTTLTWQSRLCGGRFHDADLHHDAKIRELIVLLEGELKEEQAVVWCRYTLEIEAIAEALSARGMSVQMLHGETEDNPSRISRFQEKKTRVLVAQAKCIQMGIDLSVADTAIYFSNWLDFEIRAQSEDRIEHPKKKSPLLIVDLVAKDTVDEDFVEALSHKGRDARDMLRNFLSLAKKRIA